MLALAGRKHSVKELIFIRWYYFVRMPLSEIFSQTVNGMSWNCFLNFPKKRHFFQPKQIVLMEVD
jgi:hypothetical protein